MQRAQEEFDKAGAQLIAVSSSSVEDHGRMADRLGIRFPVLSDPEGKAIRDYGLLHPGGFPGSDMPVARPAEFILDEKGIIRARILTDNWRVRARPELLLDRVREARAQQH